jgi:hypothetical protein
VSMIDLSANTSRSPWRIRVITVSLPTSAPTCRPKVIFSGRVLPFAVLTRPLDEQRSAMHSGRVAFVIAGPGIRKADRISDRTPSTCCRR